MKTEVIMKRELLGGQIRQRSKSEFFSVNDLVEIGNLWRLSNGMKPFSDKSYFNTKGTKEFIAELESKYGVVKKTGRGANGGTWVHPLLFIDIALAINPKLKVEVYEWLFDKLIKYRNDSGDTYKEMCAALATRTGNLRDFPKSISKVAEYIKVKVGVKDWQTASEKQLEQRDKIHLAIRLYCKVLTNPNEAVRLAVEEVLGGMKNG